MANEKRLIDANEALRMIQNSCTDNPYITLTEKRMWKNIHAIAMSCVSASPTVDAVEVVRCWKCAIPHNKYTGCPKLNGLVTPPDFYCPYGERRIDG